MCRVYHFHHHTLSPVPKFLDPVFAKTSLKRSFTVIDNERFGLVFAKNWVYNFGNRSMNCPEPECISFHRQQHSVDVQGVYISTTSSMDVQCVPLSTARSRTCRVYSFPPPAVWTCSVYICINAVLSLSCIRSVRQKYRIPECSYVHYYYCRHFSCQVETINYISHDCEST
jgi:hypothetical protein